MKLAIECEVLGRTKLEATFAIVHDGKIYTFAEAGGFLARICIEMRVPNPEKFFNLIERNSEGVSTLRGGADVSVVDSIVQEFREIESLASYSAAIRKVCYESARYELIPETPEEKRQVQFSSIRAQTGLPTPATLDRGQIVSIVKTRARYSSLTVVLAFYREGSNAFDDREYIDAFTKLYLILEDRYAPGIKDVKTVRQKFREADELGRALDATIRALGKSDAGLLNVIRQKLARYQKRIDAEGIIHLLTETRGELHHFVDRSRKLYANPFRKEDYRTEALLLLTLSN